MRALFTLCLVGMLFFTTGRMTAWEWMTRRSVPLPCESLLLKRSDNETCLLRMDSVYEARAGITREEALLLISGEGNSVCHTCTSRSCSAIQAVDRKWNATCQARLTRFMYTSRRIHTLKEARKHVVKKGFFQCQCCHLFVR